MTRLNDIGEEALIELLKDTDLKHREVVMGIGDDTAVLNLNGTSYVLTTDSLVEDVHFKSSWMSPYHIGYKAVQINISDVAAMGCIPMFCLVSFSAPSELSVKNFGGIYRGIKTALSEGDIDLIGGNMSGAEKLSLTLTMIGRSINNKVVYRHGAKPGDKLLISGSLGLSRAGLASLELGLKGYPSLKKAFLSPHARTDIIGDIVPYASSMMDISDGLSSDLNKLCCASGVGAIVEKKSLPRSRALSGFASETGNDVYDLIINGGEDYELLFTVRESDAGKVPGKIIGSITESREILVHDKDSSEELLPGSYRHFK